MYSKLVSFLSILGATHAAVHNVDVGEEGLKFTPDTITAAMGDKVNFHFYPGGHSVAQSTFSAPCMPSGNDAIYSGFIVPASGVDKMMFQITINSTDPIWIYCSQISHCQNGMAMVINAPSDQTIEQYIAAASKTTSSTSPGSVGGGVIIANSDSGGSGASSASAMSSAMSSAMASSSAAASGMMSSSGAAMMSSSAASGMMGSPSMSGMMSAPSGTASAPAATSSSASVSPYPGAADHVSLFLPAMIVAIAGAALGNVL